MPETPGEKVMRQWYQGKLAERMGQFAAMMKARQLLHRGALKMQDGTLGQPGEPETVEDMNIRIGDENHYPTPITPSEPGFASKIAPLLLAAALGAGGLALWNAIQPNDPIPTVIPIDTDTNTQYILGLVPDSE